MSKTKQNRFNRLISVLETGKGEDGEEKHILICSESDGFSLDELDSKQIDRLLKALEKTRVLVFVAPISMECNKKTSKRLRKAFGLRQEGSCEIGRFKREKKNDITYFSPRFFNTHYLKEGEKPWQRIAII